MNFYINEKEFIVKDDLDIEKTYKEIIQYLKSISSIIVNENGIPINETDLKKELSNQKKIKFNIKLLRDYENEIIESVVIFSENLLSKIEELKLTDKKELILSFLEVSNTLIELSEVDKYFKIDIIIQSEIEKSIRDAEQFLQEEDYISIQDIVELVYVEFLEEFIINLKKRKKSNV